MVYLKVGSIDYQGSLKLLQFNVNNISMYSTNNDSRIEVKFELQRMYMYHLVNTYMPTVCLVAIAEITLFIDETHFESNIIVALTGMLVMYTLYQSISVTLPQTAYLKLLDYWLIFCLIMPFVIFMIEVFWELQMQNKSKIFCLNKGKDNLKVKNLKSTIKKKTNRNCTRYLVLGITVLFTASYILYIFFITLQ